MNTLRLEKVELIELKLQCSTQPVETLLAFGCVMFSYSGNVKKVTFILKK